jgi:NTP pyrophosphatase (non-canonical NTP hydrolase)
MHKTKVVKFAYVNGGQGDKLLMAEIQSTYEEVARKALAFRDAHDWAQFHNPKDLAISISLEASELLECFQWSGNDVNVDKKHEAMVEELADITNYCILMADKLGVNLLEAVSSKMIRMNP